MQDHQELQLDIPARSLQVCLLVQRIKAVELYLAIDFCQTVPSQLRGSSPNTLTNFINCLLSSPATMLRFAYKWHI